MSKDKSVKLYGGRKVEQLVKVEMRNGKPFIAAADHFFVVNQDGTRVKHKGTLKMGMGIKIPEYQSIINDIIKNPNLLDSNNNEIPLRTSQKLESFIGAWHELFNYLSTPLGNIPVKAEHNALSRKWHEYLFSGRELIDEIGLCINICTGYDQNIKGINKDKLTKIENDISQKQRHGHPIPEKLLKLLEHKEAILEFIDIRNCNKKRCTIVDFPQILPSGKPEGGAFEYFTSDSEKRRLEFVPYLPKSCKMILDIAKIILG